VRIGSSLEDMQRMWQEIQKERIVGGWNPVK